MPMMPKTKAARMFVAKGFLYVARQQEGIFDTLKHKKDITERVLRGLYIKTSISRVISHVTCYKFNSSHCLKLQYSDWRASLVKDFF